MASQNRTHASDRGKAVVDIPTVPTIGTATAGGEEATVAFTPSTKGGAATTYTALSNPGSITGTGSSSPVTVTGLTAGTAYTFTVRGNNVTGSSEYSAASNSIVPIVGNSYASIATQVVGAGGAASVTFSSIPSTYKHLQIRAIGRDNRATYGISELALQFNGDTGNNYSFHGLYGNGTIAVSESVTTQPYIRANGMLGTTTGGTFGAFVIDILDYTNTSKNTTTRNLCGVDFNGDLGTGFGGRAGLWSGAWYNTNAVNSIVLYSTNGNLQQYSHFALYGIKG